MSARSLSCTKEFEKLDLNQKEEDLVIQTHKSENKF
jgi:hypothetical protein